jgi:hypothetical protein
MPMPVRVLLGFAVMLLLGLLPGRAPAQAPLEPERSIQLPGVLGRIDHMTIDLRRRRLFVAELGNGTAEAIDLGTGRPFHRIGNLKEPQGVGYSAQADMLAIAAGGDGSVHLYRGDDLSPAATISLGSDADNVRVDPQTGHFIVGYGSGGLAEIDAANHKVVRRVVLPAHPEGFQIEAGSSRVFVNVPEAGQIAVANLAAGRIETSWRPGEGSGNFPMALNGHLLVTVFRTPPRFAVLDTRTGSVLADGRTCGDADDVFFDDRRQRLYVSCGDGQIAAYQHDGDTYRALPPVRTLSGARTALFVPTLDRLFVAARAGPGGRDAAILVFRPVP